MDLDLVADLAKLAIGAEEKEYFLESLMVKLNKLQVLQEVETKGVEPLIYLSPVKNVWREDRKGSSLEQSAALLMPRQLKMVILKYRELFK